jgi:hypothetical protein
MGWSPESEEHMASETKERERNFAAYVLRAPGDELLELVRDTTLAKDPIVASYSKDREEDLRRLVYRARKAADFRGIIMKRWTKEVPAKPPQEGKAEQQESKSRKEGKKK